MYIFKKSFYFSSRHKGQTESSGFTETNFSNREASLFGAPWIPFVVADYVATIQSHYEHKKIDTLKMWNCE